MDIFMIQYNYQCKYLVILDGKVYVYKYENCNFDQPFLSFKPKYIFIGKSKVCPMTERSDAVDEIDFDGNTLLLECGDKEYVSGLEIFEFKTDDKIIDYISLIGNNMVRYAFIIGEKYIYFIDRRYKFIEKDKIEEGTLLNATDNSLDPFDYHLEKFGVDSFKKVERSLFHTFWPCVGEDIEDEDDNSDVEYEVEEDEELVEINYANGNNEMVKIFNQKCVICYKKDSIYAFRQCGHQCSCEQCYQSRSDIDKIKCVVCRT